MRTIFVLFDSLNRKALEPYGGTAIATPNFRRLAERSITFDNHYVGSLPCMPARRDMHTGRLNFMHRGWGPLEPFDNSFAAILREHGVYSHLVSDHFHYWGDGGATYHNRYDSYEFIRGQEGDPWKAMVEPPWERWQQMYHPQQFTRERRHKLSRHMTNREFIREYEDFPSVRCFDAGLDFLQLNREASNWLLHLETFDPHEPFHAPARFREPYATSYRGPTFDWPPYARVTESAPECEEIRANYAAIVALCDHELGRLLDVMDRDNMWDDTALVVTTDHGFLLGEHDWWAKNVMPCYNEVAHIPLFFSHPGLQAHRGTHRTELTQTIDVMPTLLDIAGVRPPPGTMGQSLLEMVRQSLPGREAAIYGVFGSAVNVTDGRFTYLLYPPDIHGGDLYQYTLMPMHLKGMFSAAELADATLTAPLPHCKDVPVLRVPATPKSPFYNHQGPGVQNDTVTVLYDLLTDPDQSCPLDDPGVAQRMRNLALTQMQKANAPAEYLRRMGLADAAL